LVPKNSI